jgi:hypothetical protein
MSRAKKIYIALLAPLLLLAGNAGAQSQSTQQSSDQTKTDSNATKKSDAKKPAPSVPPAPAPAATPAPATPASTPATNGAPSAKPAAAKPSAPANSAGMVWVNTESGVYHKPGTRWYGKTKQGKYMTEADAIKAGYHPAAKN